jgi:hypothetical protein
MRNGQCNALGQRFSGEEQPPFEGRFIDKKCYMLEIPEPVAWRPCSSAKNEKMKNNLIACSGACHSGKSSFIKECVNMRPDLFMALEENIRAVVTDIDEIRRQPEKYLELQFQRITLKEEEERAASKKAALEGMCVLVDRSLIDSLFYYTFYVDKSGLTPAYTEAYHQFHQKLMNWIAEDRYKMTLLFKPIKPTEKSVDDIRPDSIEVSQDTEWAMINALTRGLTSAKKICEVYVNQGGAFAGSFGNHERVISHSGCHMSTLQFSFFVQGLLHE